MSKIPQGEWSAIAARYAQGESLSAIARSYGCTPPAIHYVLKRNERQTADKAEKVERAPAAEQPVEPAPAHSSEPPRQTPPLTPRPNGEITLSLNRSNEPAGADSRKAAPPMIGLLRAEQPAAVRPVHREQQPVAEQQRPGSFYMTGRASTFTDGLDHELHERAEAAIETFRLCFDAALAEGSPLERARLRQAASDLMRVAARTTIVLDRLNALSERAAARSDLRSNNSNRPA